MLSSGCELDFPRIFMKNMVYVVLITLPKHNLEFTHIDNRRKQLYLHKA